MHNAALSFPLSRKYLDFMASNARYEFLEGTTFAGKTTVGQVKYMLKVAESSKQTHVLCGLDLGTIEKNIITKDNGILDVFGELVAYYPSGHGKHSLPHLALHTDGGDKIIYIIGYDTKVRWKKVLGGQYGCLLIDEINVADMELVREMFMRCDYALCTLNPDDPRLPVYQEYINHARPLPQWAQDTPPEIREQLCETPYTGWVHWFFSFRDNASLTPEKYAQIISSVAPGTKQYKNKIQGLRGRASGLVFNLQSSNLISQEAAQKHTFLLFTSGLDTAYSQSSADTFSFVFGGITT
ncbi:MAG: terminase, partial [Ruthenibacterium sp.]